MPDEPLEYDCSDCGLHILAFGGLSIPAIPRCTGCQWLCDTVFPSEEEREKMRAVMVERGMIDPPLRTFRAVTS